MDPNLFHLDWERTFEALVGIVIFAFIIERGLSFIFDSRWYIERVKGIDLSSLSQTDNAPAEAGKKVPKKTEKAKGLKELIAFIVSVAVCVFWQFDAVSIIFLRDQVSVPGFFITGAVIAGGSKASIKLFRDLMDFKSSALREYEDIKKKTKKNNAASEGQAA